MTTRCVPALCQLESSIRHSARTHESTQCQVFVHVPSAFPSVSASGIFCVISIAFFSKLCCISLPPSSALSIVTAAAHFMLTSILSFTLLYTSAKSSFAWMSLARYDWKVPWTENSLKDAG